MIASQTVYLAADQKTAVLPGPQAKFLLVREGHDIEQSVAEKYDGAIALIGGKKAKPEHPSESPKPKNREQSAPKRSSRGKK